MSEGEFSQTGFTTNISDLESAASFLTENYEAPKLLIGHSLGGTAVLHASDRIGSIEAVCTIGSPFEPNHVLHLLESGREEIEREGVAEVHIGGRPFNIGKEFLEDIETHKTEEFLPNLRKALLIMHSPQDAIVEIDNAARIYVKAHHPKSFITLDGADHLLTNPKDAAYAANMIASWVTRYLPPDETPKIDTPEDVAVQLGTDGYTTEVQAGKHTFLADEPADVGGNDMGPTPYQLLNAALGTCTAMTLKMYADRKKWPLERVTVHLSHSKKHLEDSSHPESKNSKIEEFNRILEIEGELDEDQRNRLLEIADKCPVHRTLTERDVHVKTVLKGETSA